MKLADKPRQLGVPFAVNGTKNTVPFESTQNTKEKGIATYDSGFPPITMTAIAAGGIPPQGNDFNGVLNDITAAIRFAQAGGLYTYNAAFSSSISGYAAGSLVLSSDGMKIWWNTVDGNVTDPDSTTASGWAKLADRAGLYLEVAKNLSDLQNKNTARTNLGLKGAAILDVGTTAGTVAAGNDTRIVNALQKGNNLSELTNKETARDNLDLGSAATKNTGTSGDAVPLLNGANTWSAAQTFNSSVLTKNGVDITGRFAAVTVNGAAIVIKPVIANYACYIIAQDSDGSNLWYIGKGSSDIDDAVFNNYKAGNRIVLRSDGSLDLISSNSQPANFNGEPRTTSPNAWRIAYGNYGTFWRNDGGSLYLMLTNKGDAEGSFNSLRPFRIDLANGNAYINNLTLITPLPVSSGGTGGNTQATARAGIGCGTAATMSYSTVDYTALGGNATEAASTKQLVGLRDDVYTKTESNKLYPLRDQITYVGIASGDETAPYVRSAASSNVITMATRTWADARYQLKNTASKAANGWHKDTSTGMITQWGTAAGGADDSYYTVNTPIAFPTAFVSLQVYPIYPGAITSGHTLSSAGKINSTSQFGYGVSDGSSGSISAQGVYWEAKGY
jgi:Tail fiber protein gp37 C terminal.